MSVLLVDVIKNSSGVQIISGLNGIVEMSPNTVVPTPLAGGLEYDGQVFYNSPVAGDRGLAPTEYIMLLTSANALANQTGAQPMFDGGGGPAGGALSLDPGAYEFECQYALTNMATGTSQTFGFAIGGTATKTEAWRADAVKAALTTASAPSVTWNTAANTALTGNNSTATGHAMIKGFFRITVAGTIIPQTSLGAASAVSVSANSFFKCKPVGASGFVSLGPWA